MMAEGGLMCFCHQLLATGGWQRGADRQTDSALADIKGYLGKLKTYMWIILWIILLGSDRTRLYTYFMSITSHINRSWDSMLNGNNLHIVDHDVIDEEMQENWKNMEIREHLMHDDTLNEVG